MTELPKVSIITPSFNQGHFIAETIESVLGQNYPHLEYLIIDGGSTDNTLEVIQRYAHDARLSWVSEPDKGMSDALNKGFGRATGDIFTWLNSDDTFIGQVLPTTVDFLTQHPEIALVYGDAVYTNPDGSPTGERQFGKPFDFIESVSYNSCIPQPGCFFRRHLWEKTGQIRLDLRYAMDLDYWLRASQHGKFQYLPGDRATYRLHPASKTWGWEKALAEQRQLVYETLQNPHYAPHIQLLEANLALTYADHYTHAGQPAEARRYLREAFAKTPWRARKIAILLKLLDAQFGTRSAAWLRRGLNWLKARQWR